MRDSARSDWESFWKRGRKPSEIYDNAGRVVDEIAARMDPEGLLVLEVGAATARDSADLAARGAVAVGLDYSPAAIALAREAAGDAVLLVRGDALALPFRDGSFDLVFHQGVLEHFRNPAPLLRENIRVLKAGGQLLVDVPQTFHVYTLFKKMLMAAGAWFAGWETQFTRRGLERLLLSTGFEPGQAYARFFSPSLAYRIFREVLLRAGVRLPLHPVLLPQLHRLRSRIRGSVERSALGTSLGAVIGVFARKPGRP
ncbi:class I SAM-dependent methyltransferase [Candidatus Fermentibacteria bacterium]|nr:class I SAM-dependent methyltransferase [Candidatus Fermentibacteria bacterium]